MSMIKTLIFHHLPDLNDLPAAERWFYRYHVPEVMRERPVSYLSYRVVPDPPGAEDYGCFNYKLHENLSSGDSASRLALTATTPEVVPLRVIMVNVPATPTEDFKGSDLSPQDTTILRWVTVFRYPQGVTPEEGDEWYLDVHVPEVLEQPGLTRFFSYRVLPFQVPAKEGPNRFFHPRSEFSTDWHRVSELWYEDSRGWTESVISSPPVYTRPGWAERDTYPFLEPTVDFAGVFILERPSDDWLRVAQPTYA